MHGILHSSSEKGRFVLEIVEPLEFALRENNTHTYMNVTFGRDAQTQAVNRLTLKLEVDLEYEKKQGAQIVGWFIIGGILIKATNRFFCLAFISVKVDKIQWLETDTVELEPRHEKPVYAIRAVWSAPLLFAAWIV